MTSRSLTIFLSYVSEDQKFADAIADRLASTFKFAIELKYMSQFQLGMNFRTLIDQALDSADILLVIATGHEKLSHSFTGYEVGFFRKSQQTRPFIDGHKGLERLIIPIAMLADIPATLSDIEGIGIAEKDRFLFDLDETGQTAGEKQDPFFDLLARIDSVLDKLNGVDRSPDQRQKTYDDYHKESKAFYQDLVKVMSSLPLRREFPKTRLTLRLPADYSAKDVELESGVIMLSNGPTAGMFEQEQSEQWATWADFSKRIGPNDIALSWSDALRTLIASTLVGDFTNSDQLVFSFDGKKLFRLFVSKSTTFFDRSRELDVYVVEVLRYKDIGDPYTTFLAKAIAIALRYRSLFLEGNSPYGPIAIRFCRKEEWKSAINQLLRELRLLIMQSREAGLGERRHIIELYGSDDKAVDGILASMSTWLDQKTKLHGAAGAVLAEMDPAEATFDAFLSTLKEFCVQTKQINLTFTATVLKQLEEVLKDG